MKQSVFISELRERMATLPTNEVMRMALQIARYVPRDAYGEVLDRTLETAKVMARHDQGIDLLSSVEQLCEAIADGRYTLTWGYAEGGYGDWYSEDDALHDKDGLGPELEHCLRAAMDSVKQARYEEALLALGALFAIEVEIEGYDTASLKTLFKHEIVGLGYDEILCQYAYAVMMHCRGQERLLQLYEIERLHHFSLPLQKIEEVGAGSIPERDVFAEQWVQYLMEQDLTRYQSLIIDAAMYQGGTETLETLVLAHGAKYPKAYIHLLELYLTARRFDDTIRIIEDGLAKIAGINPYRAKMADMLAETGRAIGNRALIKRGVEEAFHASVDISHFLALFALRDEALLARAMRHLDAEHEAQTDRYHPFDYYYIHFLQGDYRLVWEACRKDSNALGWSNSVKGKMMPLFVALLAGANKVGCCARQFLREHFSVCFYGEDADEQGYRASESFADALSMSLLPLSSEAKDEYQRWCVREAEARVQAVVGGQYRGSYHKASALVVSIAESMLAQGDARGAAELVIGYKEKYPRHTAFHRCMREDIKRSALNVSL